MISADGRGHCVERGGLCHCHRPGLAHAAWPRRPRRAAPRQRPTQIDLSGLGAESVESTRTRQAFEVKDISWTPWKARQAGARHVGGVTSGPHATVKLASKGGLLHPKLTRSRIQFIDAPWHRGKLPRVGHSRGELVTKTWRFHV